MYWNHRVIRSRRDGEDWYAIHEVYYDDEDRPEACTAIPEAVEGESLEELDRYLAWMRASLRQPVLTVDDAGRLVEDEAG
ncbi:MAG TPA: hypothetical protein VK066_32105 [Chloroflexota bacterium]|nr:hypothetical protein [Chloroflexota bacterium]